MSMNHCVILLLWRSILQSKKAKCTGWPSPLSLLTLEFVLYTKRVMGLLCLQILVILIYKNHLFKILCIFFLWLPKANAKRYASHIFPPAASRCSINFLAHKCSKQVFCQHAIRFFGVLLRVVFAFLQLVGPVSIHLYTHHWSK